MDTIFAVASGAPPAAIAIMRISGPAAFAALDALGASVPAPRHAVLRTLRGETGVVLDRALVTAFAAPASATGEDVVELHLHGGRAIVAVVDAALAAMPGLRRAEAGEFTRRALTNGRIDLAEAEGLADLLAAETEQQRRAAMAMAEGQLSRRVRGWMDEVAALRAIVEARIEYAEEGDEAIVADDLASRTAALRSDMVVALADPPVDRVRDGIRVVVAGPPNTGKSSLINALAAREVAIVAPVSGTTRDRIEAPVQRNGLPFVLIDTAGIGATEDAVERIGVELARQAAEDADILLWTGDDRPPPGPAIWLWPRADIPTSDVESRDIAVSVFDPTSLVRLWSEIERRARALSPRMDGLPYTRQQCDILNMAVQQINAEGNDLLQAEALRVAHGHLASILGLDATGAMLDSLFSRFCVGK